MAFSLRDFCEPGDEYVDFATGTRETIAAPRYKVVRHADRGIGTQVIGTDLSLEEAEELAATHRGYHDDTWTQRYTVEPDKDVTS